VKANEHVQQEMEEVLKAIPLATLIRVRVCTDIGGWSVFGTGILRGITGAGRTREHALRVFFDNVITEYYEYSVKPFDTVVEADALRGARLREIFWPKRSVDYDKASG
jgi:hypothetical protein